MSARDVSRYVADLIRGRRPRRFRAAPEDLDELRAAIMLRSATPGGTEPSETFVTELRQRLATELAEDLPPKTRTRRRVVRDASLAAASAAAGLAAGAALTASDTAPNQQRPSASTLTPDDGTWRAVTAARDLPEGRCVGFDLGAVTGFVRRADGRLDAVSGICTHLGCRLTMDEANKRLNCPCHRTTFSVDGEVVAHQLPTAPPPLPHLRVRESGGSVEILTPPTPN